LSQKGSVAAVFGPEKSGISNTDLHHGDTLLQITPNRASSSLNLAMSVQVFTYELRMALMGETPASYTDDTPLATSDELEHFYAHLESVLTEIDFLDPENPRHLMRRLRRLFIRAQVDKNEINILRGILTAIDKRNGTSE